MKLGTLRMSDNQRTEKLTVSYTNYRGETAKREIFPLLIWFGATEYHPEPQWIMRAMDAKRPVVREFAMRNMVPLS